MSGGLSRSKTESEFGHGLAIFAAGIASFAGGGPVVAVVSCLGG